LAAGTINKPVLVKVEYFSENAAKKIEEAGGEILKKEQEESAETKN